MVRLEFDKYEGLGNDFLVAWVEDAASYAPDFARKLCDRHLGVGGDGVLLVTPAQNAGARARMIVLNADGSRPEMCGNGLRCVALYLAQSDEQTHARFSVETDAGLKTCEVTAAVSPDQVHGEVTVSMGYPKLGPVLRVDHAGQSYEFHQVSMGNPHAIALGPVPTEELIDDLGPKVCAAVAGGSNVEFAELQADGVRLVVWERGVGRTLACGTGACATVAAAAERGLLPHDQWVTVQLPGGTLRVRSDGTGESWLSGPARRVFRGSVEI